MKFNKMKFNRMSYLYVIWMAIFIIVPLLLVIYYSVTTGAIDDFTSMTFTLEYFKNFFSSQYLVVLLNSIKLALISTLICLLLGYPMALFISKSSYKARNVMMLMVVIPMWMNFLLRTYAWMTILSKNGIINSFLGSFGIEPLKLMYTEGAILTGMVYNFLPFMILPIYSVIEKMDYSLIEAAEDLGATKFQCFRKIILPLSLPGIITGITMVFIPAISTFEISALLGGNKYNLIGNIIEHQFRIVGEWHYGSAMSMILMVMILLSMIVTNRFDSDDEKNGGGLW